MGGAVCRILVFSILGPNYDQVPDPVTPEFDAGLRKVYANDEFAQSVVNDTNSAQAVCAVLEKSSWTNADRQELISVINAICGPYTS